MEGLANMRSRLAAGVAICIICQCGIAIAQVTCDISGPGPDPVDPKLAPKVIAWVTNVERNLGLSSSRWRGKPAHAATTAQTRMLELQAFIGDWVNAARPGTVDYIFRSAVAHGVNVQYEMLLIAEDPANAQKHQFWVDTEAARAAACLDLIQLPVAYDR
jgi:hypothetical protein